MDSSIFVFPFYVRKYLIIIEMYSSISVFPTYLSVCKYYVNVEMDSYIFVFSVLCVGTLPQGYIRNVPLPRVPRGQSAKSHTQVHRIPNYYKTPYVVPTYVSPRSIVESAAYAFSPAWHTIAINT
jgi:hypothetical protein